MSRITIMISFLMLGISSVQAGLWDADWPTVSAVVTSNNPTWSAHPTRLNGVDDNPDGFAYAMYSNGPLLGNGDAGVVVGSDNSKQTLYLTTNNHRGGVTYTGGIGRHRNLSRLILSKVSGPSAAGSISITQDILRGEVRSTVVLSGTAVHTKTWVQASGDNPENLVITELSHNAGGTVRFKAEGVVRPNVYHFPSTVIPIPTLQGTSNNDTMWVIRKGDDTTSPWKILPLGTVATRVVGASNVVASSPGSTANSGAVSLSFDVPSGTPVYLVSKVRVVYGRWGGGSWGGIKEDYLNGSDDMSLIKDAPVARVQGISANDIATLYTDHKAWWKEFWLRSYVDIGDDILHKFYYNALYVAGSASRGEKMPAGLWGPWVVGDECGWAGGHYGNYNYESFYYGIFTANRCELNEPNVTALVSSEHNARVLAGKAGFSGIHLQRLSGFDDCDQAPYFSSANVTAIDIEPTKDRWTGYVGDSIKGPIDRELRLTAWHASILIRHYYMTKDPVLRDRIYPFLKGAAEFYLDGILKFDGTHYYIPESAVNEQISRPFDTNSIADLSMMKYLFRALVTISAEKGVDANLRTQWQDCVDKMHPYPRGNYVGHDTGAATIPCFKEAEIQEKRGSKEVKEITSTRFSGGLIAGWYPTYNQEGSREDFQQTCRNSISALHKEKLSFEMLDNAKSGFENNFCQIYPAAARAGFMGVDPSKHFIDEFHDVVEHNFVTEQRDNYTVFQDGGGIETCGGIEAIHELLMQSHMGYIEIFPYWPKERPAKFVRLRAEGAFLVSSELSGGAIVSLTIFSERGERCAFKNPWPGTPLVFQKEGTSTWTSITVDGITGIAEFDTDANSLYTIRVGSNGNLHPIVMLQADTVRGVEPVVVNFTSTGSYDDDGSIVNYEWDFDGDGQIDQSGASLDQITHTFSEGNYTAHLYAVDNAGGRGVATMDISVELSGLNAGLVHYKLDEGTGTAVADSSGYGNDGTISVEGGSGYEWVAPGYGGGGRCLKATSSDYGKINLPAGIYQRVTDNNAVSICFWIKEPRLAQPLACFEALNGSELKIESLLFSSGTDVKGIFRQYNNATQSNYIQSNPFAVNDWAHVAFVRDHKTDTLQVFKNGVLLAEKSGIDYSLGQLTDMFFRFKMDALIDELRVFYWPLTAADLQVIIDGDLPQKGTNGNKLPVVKVQSNKVSGTEPLTVNFSSTGSFDSDGSIVEYQWDFDGDGSIDQRGATLSSASHTFSRGSYDVTLYIEDDAGEVGSATVLVSVDVNGLDAGIVYYDLNEGAGTTANDRSGNGNHGTITSTKGNGLEWISPGYGGTGSCVRCTGADQGKITLPAGISQQITDNNAISVSLWVRDASNSYQPFFEAKDGSDSRIWLAFWGSSAVKGMFRQYDSATTGNQTLQSATTSTAGWTHWVFIRDHRTNTLQIYKDGSLFAEQANIAYQIGNLTELFFNGQMEADLDELRVYYWPLSASDVTALYTGQVTQPPAGYDSWTITKGLSGGDADRTADPDNDGIANLLEFALGLDPNQKDMQGLPTLTRTGDQIDYTFSTGEASITYQVEVSNDLTGSWRSFGNPISGGAASTTETLSLSNEMGSDDRLFIRLKVTE